MIRWYTVLLSTWVSLVLTKPSAWAQVTPPTEVWSRTLGGADTDQLFDIVQAGNGYIAAGHSWSTDGDVLGNHSIAADIWVVRLDQQGNKLWHKCYGGTYNDWIGTLVATSDGGTIFTASSYSDDGDVGGQNPPGNNDAWIVKLDADGNIQWKHIVEGTSDDEYKSVVEVSDGYLAIGQTLSDNGIFSDNHGSRDVFITKYALNGTPLWTKMYGGNGAEDIYKAIKTTDGSVLIVGMTDSNNYNIGFHGFLDGFAMKITPSGDLLFFKAYGGTGLEHCSAAIQTTSDTIILIGTTDSVDGDITDHPNYEQSAWLMYISAADGHLLHSITFGSNKPYTLDRFYSILPNSSGYLIGGCDRPYNETFYEDLLLLQTDPQGNVLWNIHSGVQNFHECAYAITPSFAQGFVVVSSAPATVPEQGANAKITEYTYATSAINNTDTPNPPQLYYNPHTQQLHTQHATNIHTLYIYNTLGQLLYTSTTPAPPTLSLAWLPTGTYHIQGTLPNAQYIRQTVFKY